MSLATSYDYTVIDSHLLAYRSWWPVRELRSSDGTHTGLEFGFIKNVLSIARLWQPARVILAWDGYPTRCASLFPQVKDDTGKESGYKSGRQKHADKEAEPPWSPRLERLRHAFLPLISTLYDPRAEADEEIARFCFWAEARGKRTLIISKDRDLHQLVSDSVHLVLGPEEADIYTPEKVEAEWGVPPKKLTFRRAIEGDSSDAVPGAVPRLPKEIICRLANDSESIDDLLLRCQQGYAKTAKQLDNLLAGRPMIKRNWQLFELASQAQYKPTLLPGTTGDGTALRQLVRELQCNSLLNRREWVILEEMSQDLLSDLSDLEA
jgi:DNA polymerase-1